MWNSKMKIQFGMVLITAVLLSNLLPAQTVVRTELNDKVLLWIEAEAGDIIDPMLVHDTEKASGGQYIEVRGGNNNVESAPDGLAFYKFNLENAGTYKIWGRVNINMHDEDAFWVKMDDQNWVKWKGIEVGCKWHWDEVHDTQKDNQVVIFNLDAGSHTLTLTYGMDQTTLDKWLITNDLEYIPTEAGPRAEAIIKSSPKMPILNKKVRFDGSESSSTEGSVITYQWDFGNGEIISGVNVDRTFATAGEYPVKLIVTDDAGLTSRVTKTVTVYTEEPVARFKYSPDRTKANEIVNFDASGSYNATGKIVNYQWDFGDGSRGEGVTVAHPYTAAGEYFTTLTVTDDKGKTDKKTRLVTVITGVPKKIIYETDMCLDADDVGALAMLHGLANNDEVDLLAVCFNEVYPSAAAAIDAMNTWYGRGDIPVGIYKKDLPDPDLSFYLDAVAKFPHDLSQESAPSAVDVYKDLLSEQADKSVTIISVGFIVNLYDLLLEEPDLIEKKVAELVIMGGPRGGGFNLGRHNTSSLTEHLLEHWPTPIVFSGAGTGIFTAERLENTPKENPIREAYYQFFNSNFCQRHSWDQMAVLYGVRGVSDYFDELENVDRWGLKPGMRLSLKTRLKKDEYAKIIEDLMLVPPK
jgi:PKD repeat protein